MRTVREGTDLESESPMPGPAHLQKDSWLLLAVSTTVVSAGTNRLRHYYDPAQGADTARDPSLCTPVGPWPFAMAKKRYREKGNKGKKGKRKKRAKTIKNAPNGIRTKDPSARNCTPFKISSSFSRPSKSVTLFGLRVETRLFLTRGCFTGP